jgi:hypothetical protein
MRAVATIVSSLVMALAAIGLAVAAPGRDHDGPQMSLAGASGAVAITNSHDGDAVLSAANLRPGQTVTGVVAIGNAGDAAGRFTVLATHAHDDPGPNGGLLSQRLVVGVYDITGGGSRQIFLGPAGGFGESEVGTLAPGAARSLLVTATLPEGGAPASDTTGDNRFQQSSVSVDLEWRAGVAAQVVPTPTPAPKPKPKPTPTPTPTPSTPTTPAPSTADLLGLPPASTCVDGGTLKFKLKAPPETKLKSAVVSASGKRKLKLRGAKLKKTIKLRGLRKKTTKLKVTAKAANRRTYKASRSYKRCA